MKNHSVNDLIAKWRKPNSPPYGLSEQPLAVPSSLSSAHWPTLPGFYSPPFRAIGTATGGSFTIQPNAPRFFSKNRLVGSTFFKYVSKKSNRGSRKALR
jgi:hypothetical protein